MSNPNTFFTPDRTPLQVRKDMVIAKIKDAHQLNVINGLLAIVDNTEMFIGYWEALIVGGCIDLGNKPSDGMILGAGKYMNAIMYSYFNGSNSTVTAAEITLPFLQLMWLEVNPANREHAFNVMLFGNQYAEGLEHQHIGVMPREHTPYEDSFAPIPKSTGRPRKDHFE